MDVSSNMIFEDNTIRSTEAGQLPHGNSVSFYDWRHVPAASNWSFSHNAMSRPDDNDHRNWAYHETFTTDGPGGWGAGPLQSISPDRRTLTLEFDLRNTASVVGATVMVCGGEGLGQHVQILSKSFGVDVVGRKTTLLHLAAPLDSHVVPGPGGSRVCVTATVGSKIVSGNTFTWGMVVQWFGTTARGVIADNHFQDCNVDYGRGALMGFGLCYQGPQPMWACEYSGNTMVRSNGIALTDSVQNNADCNASTYPGPFTRWQVIRPNRTRKQP